MLDGSEVRYDDGWSSRGNVDVVTIGLRLCQGKNSRGRYLVSLETDERTVNIEK
jgi:hypothetical protein